MTKDIDCISKKKFMEKLESYRKGSITRRHFLNVTGLGAATAVLGATVPGLRPTPALAGDIGDRVILATWPNYHDVANFDAFTEATGAHVQVNVFGSIYMCHTLVTDWSKPFSLKLAIDSASTGNDCWVTVPESAVSPPYIVTLSSVPS